MKAKHIMSLAGVSLVVLAALAVGWAGQGSGGQISGRCWYDLNRDGVRDPGEPVLNGVTVVLTDPATHEVVAKCRTRPLDLNQDGKIDRRTEKGAYSFSGLVSGDYLISQVSRRRWEPTTQKETLFILERSGAPGQDVEGRKVIQRDPATGGTINVIDLPDEYPPGEIAYGPGRIYYAQAVSPADYTVKLWELDTRTGQVADCDTVPLPDEASWLKYGAAYLDGKVYLLSGPSAADGTGRLIEWDPEADEVTAIMTTPVMQANVSLTAAPEMDCLLVVTCGLQGFDLADEVMKIDPKTAELVGTVAIDKPAYAVGYYQGQILVSSYNLAPVASFPYTWLLDRETGATVGQVPADPASFGHCDKWGFAGDGVKGFDRVTVGPGTHVQVDFGSARPERRRGRERAGRKVRAQHRGR